MITLGFVGYVLWMMKRRVVRAHAGDVQELIRQARQLILVAAICVSPMAFWMVNLRLVACGESPFPLNSRDFTVSWLFLLVPGALLTLRYGLQIYGRIRRAA